MQVVPWIGKWKIVRHKRAFKRKKGTATVMEFLNGLITSIDLTKIPREQMPLIAMRTPCEGWVAKPLFRNRNISREWHHFASLEALTLALPFSFAQPSTRTSYYFAHCQPILGKLHEEFEINRSHWRLVSSRWRSKPSRWHSLQKRRVYSRVRISTASIFEAVFAIRNDNTKHRAWWTLTIIELPQRASGVPLV